MPWYSVTMFMIGGLLLHLAFIAYITVRAARRRKHRNWLNVFAGVVLFALCVELCREVKRLTGADLPITPLREMWYRFVYFSLGLYYNEVLRYVREATRSLV